MRGKFLSVVAAFVVLAIVSPAAALVTVQSACNGDGIAGSSTENGATVSFEACRTGNAVHARVWDSGGTIAEVWGNMDGTGVTYQIGGETVTGDATAEQWAYWQTALGTSAPWTVATHLVNQLKGMGFDPFSKGLVGLSVLTGPYEGSGHVSGTPIPLGCSAMNCRSAATNCRGCCGDGCGGCIVCTDACADHDDCVRNNEPMCGDRFIIAAQSIFACLASGHLTCCSSP